MLIKIKYLNKGRKYRIAKVHSQDAATARLHSATRMETRGPILLLVYLGKHVSKVSVNNIPCEIEVALLDAIVLEIEKEECLICAS